VTEYKLAISMVPPALWGRNLRSLLSHAEWNRLRKAIFAASPNCETCGTEVLGAARHAHEEWRYVRRRTSGTASLVAIKTMCRTCHFVEHQGFVNVMVAQGKFSPDIYETLTKHFCAVNGCQPADYRRHKAEAEARFDELLIVRSWKIDFSEANRLIRRAAE
jgi:hypothetical protein